tara:strand:- start:558 stop:1343 length:786 start_codon:yes stop_codon:yes gene_type:complete
MLKINNLEINIESNVDFLQPVKGATFEITKGEILGLVGESGCGKSLTALSILKLNQHPIKTVGGSIEFNKKNLLDYSISEMRKIRGKEISMIFQNPRESLNPVFKILDQLINIHQTHMKSSAEEAYNKSIEMLQSVNIPDPKKRILSYPHELSGGMCQRVMIAMALLCEPKLLIADEPTTALDVTVQAEVVDLILSLVKSRNMSCLFITHDLGLVSQICDRVAVMYQGKIVEVGSIQEVFLKPKHAYTSHLLNSILTFENK